MIRGRILAVVEGVIKRFSATGRAKETFADREYFQHYGFTSRPLAGAEGIIINKGNHIIMVASDDRRYRIAIESGEVAIYTDEGDHVHLKRGRVVEVVTDTLLVKAWVKVSFETPLVETTGQIQAVGQITDLRSGTGKSMSQMRSTYNLHTHPENDTGGPTDAPNQEM